MPGDEMEYITVLIDRETWELIQRHNVDLRKAIVLLFQRISRTREEKS